MSGSQPLSLTDSVVSHPLSAVVPTINRPRILQRTLESLAAQSVVPRELIIIDASSDEQSQAVANEWREKCAPSCSVIWQRAVQSGAAAQRNQGVALTTQPFIWFFDDDIVFEPDCVQKL